VAIEHGAPSEIQVAVEHARARSSGEVRPLITGSFGLPVSEGLAAFVDRVIGEGTYVQAIAQLVADDPELADT
jgi:hypothetical protein